MPCVRARGDQLSSYVEDLRGLLAGEREEMISEDKMQAVRSNYCITTNMVALGQYIQFQGCDASLDHQDLRGSSARLSAIVSQISTWAASISGFEVVALVLP